MSEANSQQTAIVYPEYTIQQENETNIFEFWNQIMARKAMVFVITAFFSVVSIISVLLLPRTWQAEIQFMPPQVKGVQGLNVQALNIQGVDEEIINRTQYTPSSVYNSFLINYQSTSNKRIFFNQNNVIKNYKNELLKEGTTTNVRQTEKVFKEFSQSLKLQLPKKQEKLSFVTATLDFSEPKASSDLLNLYAKMIENETLNSLVQEVISQLQQKQTNINEQILIKKRTAKQIRENRIALLNESIIAARILDLEDGKSQIITGIGAGSGSGSGSDSSSGGYNAQLYFQGYKSLEAEKKVLEERKDDTPFIKGLIGLEYQSAQISEQINRLSKNKKKFSVVRIDQKALTPDSPIKPKRKLIVIISTILGFILSLFLVLFLNIKQKNDDKYK